MSDRKSAPEGLSAYRVANLDPRDWEGKAEANRDLLGPRTLGIEVTVPALAQRCGLGNVDPQHRPVSGDRAAIEEALEIDPPPAGSTLVTIRPDLDSLGAMAVLAMRAEGERIGDEALGRIAEIAQADRHDRGLWPGPRPIEAALGESAPLAPLAFSVSDTGLALGERVALLRRWLAQGEIPRIYCERAAASRRDLVEAVRNGRLRVRPACGHRIAAVVGDQPQGLRLGYCVAAVVVALNPAFRLQGGTPHRKFTIAQYSAGHADFARLLAVLRLREPGWGGSPTIIGSPQGASSCLSLCAVIRVVRGALC